MPQITVISIEFLFEHNRYLKDWPVTQFWEGRKSLLCIKMFSRIFLPTYFLLSYFSQTEWSRVSSCLISNKTCPEKSPWAPNLNQSSHHTTTLSHDSIYHQPELPCWLPCRFQRPPQPHPPWEQNVSSQRAGMSTCCFAHLATPTTEKCVWHLRGTLVVVG